MIYFDNAATSKPDRECVERAEQYLFDDFFNPSALYSQGYKVSVALREARKNITSLIADDSFTAVFTSCGTEADNHALFCCGRRGNVVTTLGEHSAVFNAANELKVRGVEIRFARLNADGGVDVDDLLSKIDDKTSLVSVIHVNNETGAVNDINKIASSVKAKNKFTLFHSDGVQAFGKIPLRLSRDVDLYSVSAHKIGGMKGCGALIKKSGLAVRPFIFGGGQELGLRSGTENVFGIKLFEFAAKKRYAEIEANYRKVKELNNSLRGSLDNSLFKIISPENGSPYILTVAAEGVRGETILHEADDEGLIIGTGSACSSNEKNRYSRVILACGFEKELADGVLRISFSPDNSLDEVGRAAEILNRTVSERKKKMA